RPLRPQEVRQEAAAGPVLFPPRHSSARLRPQPPSLQPHAPHPRPPRSPHRLLGFPQVHARRRPHRRPKHLPHPPLRLQEAQAGRRVRRACPVLLQDCPAGRLCGGRLRRRENDSRLRRLERRRGEEIGAPLDGGRGSWSPPGGPRAPAQALAFFRWAGGRPGYDHGSVAYNALARVLAQEDSMGQFWDLIQEMKEKDHEMDIDTYIKVSRHLLKSRMVKEAVELYELMMDGPYKPAIQDCGNLLRQIALNDAPDLDLVFRVVRKYEAAGYSLSKVVYDGIHRSLTSIGKFDEAEEILKKMRLEGYEPDNITYSQLVYGLCKAKRLDDACKVFDEMEAADCTPDLKTWTVLIQGHCTAGEVDKALELLAKMIEKNCEADGDVLDVLVKGLCSKNRADAGYTLFHEMVVKVHVKPWQATYKHLIQELLKSGMLEEALKLLRSMKIHKFPPYADPFPSYIAKCGTTEDAEEFLKALTVNNYPSPAAYLHLFRSLFKEGRYSEAQDLLYKCPHHIRKNVDISELFGSIKSEKAS
ncbi:unnamed protein product, partial [Musa textilis]